MRRKPSAAPMLLNDPDVRRWNQNLARGSRATADVHLHRLAAFCHTSKTTPAALAKLPEKRLHDLLL
ncbi:MAG: hypothetical protein ACREDE_07270, partial [Thermoplasmata archaeon]